ncbi:MAG TPA: Gfo/Idh/MocA family oxidoreductase [Verrucomicrobiae bacterium]|nr:Gfo/Idh/MocA family oxidoreductase [Verrucomicrobiae bacterium]
MKKTSTDSKISRRHFLAATGAALALPTFIPASALGRNGRPAPSERVILGVAGWGMQGPGNTKHFLGISECQVVAACDLDEGRLHRNDNSAVKTINNHYKNKDCKAYHDYREMMARSDIDAVMLAVPDHWHALVATEAAHRKKDIYGEKPLARTIAEQQAIVHAVEKNGRIWQTGSWQRSEANFHKGAEIVRNGLIGRVTHVEVGLPAGHSDFPHTAPDLLKKFASKPTDNDYLTKVVPGTPDWDAAISQPPAGFDYERWIGPSRMEPYIGARVYQNWRWNYNTGGGQLLDWIGHHCDIAHWGLDFDRSGPSEIEGHGEFPPANAIWNTTGKYRIELQYPNNIKMTIAGGYPEIKSGTKWIGTDGWVYVDRGKFEASNEDWVNTRTLPENLRKIKLYESNDHWKNFIDCVKSRKPTIAPVQTAHHSAIPGHLGLISMLVGRKLRWDVASERILDDAEATKLTSRPYRSPWKFPGAHEIYQSPKAVANS